MKSYMMAIDQGTTSTRAILFNHNKEIVATSQKEFTQYFPQPGWVEHDANEIWLSTLSVISEVVLNSQIDPSEVAGIGITNQRETCVMWDRHTGLPIYHAIVWQSRQSDEICDRWKEMGLEEKIHEKTGLRIDPYFSASKICWILENVPHAREKALKGDLLFGTIDSWLVWKLSGQKVHISDVSNASRTLLYNIHEMRWDEELLEIFDIPSSILPEVKPSSYLYAKCAPYHFFNQEIPICAVIGDQQAALFGQGCLSKGSLKNTYGTGGFLLMNTGDELIESKHGLLSTVAWQINDQVQYALEGSIFVSGSLMQWLRDGLQLFSNVALSEEMALSVEDSNQVFIVPAFVGLGAPYWDEKCRGMVLGLTRGVKKEHLVRAAIESMAYQSRDLIEAMKEDANSEITHLKVDGGAIENKLLLQFQSDLLQIPVQRLAIKETTALGAAYLAGLAVGFWNEDDLNQPIEREFTPQMSKEEADENYRSWCKAVAVCRMYHGK